MEQIYFNGFQLDAQYIGYREGMKIFICQTQLVLTNKDNRVVFHEDIIPVIMSYCDGLIEL